MFSVVQSDVFAFLATVPDGSVNLIVTDPPYPGLDDHREVGTTTRLKAAGWFPTIPHTCAPRLFEEFHRVLAPGSHLYAICNEDAADVYKQASIGAGFRHRQNLIWDKGILGMGYSYRMIHELIVYAEKPPTRRLKDMSQGSILRCFAIRGEGLYPTEKPAELLRIMIRQSSNEGELVMDPFSGSGSTAFAALGLGRRFIGCDISEESIRRTVKRCERFTAAP